MKGERKRVMLSLSITDFDKLIFAADHEGDLPSTYAKKIVIRNVREVAEKNNYIEGALPGNDLFSGVKFTKKKARKRK